MGQPAVSLRREAAWAGATLVYGIEPETRDEQAMSGYTVAVAFRPIARIGWRLGTGSTRVARLEAGAGFIFTGEPFVWAPTPHGYDGLMIRLADGFLSRVTADEALVPVQDLRSAQFVRDPVLARLAGLLRAELLHGGVAGQVYQDSLLTLLAVHLLRAYPGVGTARTGRAPDLPAARVRQVVDFMQAHLSEPIGLAELAAVGCMSPFHFARVFRATVGLPPHRFLTGLRLERAAVLLRATALPTAEVAIRVGYANQSHFTAQFRRQYGCTPAAYRRDRCP